MKLKSQYLAVIIMLFIFGGVSVTSVLGWWKTTNDKVPATYKDGEYAGEYNPADIRGSYKLSEISSAFDVPVSDLGLAFGVTDPVKQPDFQVKELEALYASLAAQGKEIGTGSVRYFVALYKGLPFTSDEKIYLPRTAVEILKARAKLSNDQIKELEENSVVLPDVSITPVTPALSPSAVTSDKTTTDTTIKGTTTFNDLLSWGVKSEDIEKIIKDKLPESSKVIKDYASSKGIEFSIIKEPLQKLVDSIK